jgi:enoyl-CoA hydratase/carnithine racemase
MKEMTMTSPPQGAPSPPLLSVNGEIATLTLNRPAHRNRLEDEDLRTLLSHFARINADATIRVLVFTANTAGQPRPVFCAGYHVGGFDKPDPDAPTFEQVADAFASLRPVTVCALNGSVYGGATDLTLACDLRLGLAGCEWRMPAAALGLHYYASGLQRYVSVLGVSLARRMFLTARPVPFEALAHADFFVGLESPQTFEPALHQLAVDVAALAPLAAQGLKQSFREIAAGACDTAAMQAREQRTLHSRDFAEGRLAFQEKRQPRFTGN